MKFKEFAKNTIKLPDVRKRILFTIGILVVFRVLAAIPIPGVDPDILENASGDGGVFFAIFTTLTGGQLDNPSLVALGLAPFINASIILQLLGTVIPKLEELGKEGERGQQIINQWTRYLTFPLALLQSVVIYNLLKNPPLNLLPELNGIELIAFYMSLATGTILLMWFGELITENGIGNGPSVIITLGILASLPGLLLQDIETMQIDTLLLIIIGAIVLVGIIVYFNEALRKIPIQYARRVRGNMLYGAQDSYLPIRINMAGVMPVIFAASLLAFPQVIIQFLLNWIDPGSRIYSILETISLIYQPEYRWLYSLSYFVMIILFTFFYTFIVFKPSETADNLKKSGGFVPGIRPGKSTEEFLIYVVIRLTVVGALFLAVIALLPSLLRSSNINAAILTGIGGTSILIVVSVILDMYRQTQAMMVTRSYDVYN